jgi:outer membrane protein assembly factor BamD
VEKYPLYSRADEALYLLGQNYEGQITRMRTAPTCDVHGQPRGCVLEAVKARYIEKLSEHAAEAYSKILTRYPMMDRSDDAKKRLMALHQAIPRPTKAAVAQNKAEQASRHESTMAQRLMSVIKKGPDTMAATSFGEPSLVDPEPVAASDVPRRETLGMGEPGGKNTVGVEIVKPDQSGANPNPLGESSNASPSGGSPFGAPAANAQPAAPDPNELKPNVPADPNELKPTDNGGDPSLPPPAQVNEIQQGQSSSSSSSSSATADNSTPASDQDLSSSKKKKKKGLKKIVPF